MNFSGISGCQPLVFLSHNVSSALGIKWHQPLAWGSGVCWLMGLSLASVHQLDRYSPFPRGPLGPHSLSPFLAQSKNPRSSTETAKKVSTQGLAGGYVPWPHDEGSQACSPSLVIWNPPGLAMPSRDCLFAPDCWPGKKRGSGMCPQKAFFSAVIFKHLLRAIYPGSYPTSTFVSPGLCTQ